jgi:hypothetical protein
MPASHQEERHRGVRGADIQRPTAWAACRLGGGQRPSGLTGGACQLRAIRGGLWRRLTVTHGHSGHLDLRSRLYRSRTTRMVRMGSSLVGAEL